MANKIRVGILGYGNIGRGVEAAVAAAEDMELAAVFTRRDPATLRTAGFARKVVNISEAENYTEDIDVLILCGGSATDLPQQGPEFAARFNTVDSFDTHAKIPEYFAKVDAAAKKADKISVIATGWDPGLFSLLRSLGESVLPQGKAYTFWGKGVSQGHSDAIRRIKGVKDARQYTVPREEAVEKVRSGNNPELSTREKHLRDCYVVAEPGADKAAIETTIRTMPDYFSDYDTKVTFISEEEMARDHSAMPHGGFVLRSGQTTEKVKHLIEFRLKLDSNPEFTGSVLTAYARAAYRMHKEGTRGALTVFDIAPKYLSARTAEEMRKELL